MKINLKGFLAIIVLAFASIVILHDFAMVCIGYSFTGYGIATLIISIFLGCEAENYIVSRIKR